MCHCSYHILFISLVYFYFKAFFIPRAATLQPSIVWKLIHYLISHLRSEIRWKKPPNAPWSDNMRLIRKALKITQLEAAAILGSNSQSISRWEKFGSFSSPWQQKLIMGLFWGKMKAKSRRIWREGVRLNVRKVNPREHLRKINPDNTHPPKAAHLAKQEREEWGEVLTRVQKVQKLSFEKMSVLLGGCKIGTIQLWRDGKNKPLAWLQPIIIANLRGKMKWKQPLGATWADTLRTVLYSRNISIRQAASMLGCTHGGFANWEKGVNVPHPWQQKLIMGFFWKKMGGRVGHRVLEKPSERPITFTGGG